MALPAVLIGAVFLLAVAGALGTIVYLTWKGNKPSSFFEETVKEYYECELSEADIDAFYELKDKLQAEYAPGYQEQAEKAQEEGTSIDRWTSKVPKEDRGALQKALMRRLVSCISKLDQVQKDRPGNWKLWQSKLISEAFWESLQDAEKTVSQEIDSCISEADELEQGWKEHIFQQGVQVYRVQKQQEFDKTAQKKGVVDAKKAVEKEEKRKEVEKRLEVDRAVQDAKNAEKMMEKLLREEEQEAAAAKKGGKAKAAPGKAKPKKK